MASMVREFISTSVFDKRWYSLNLTDDDLRELQNLIMKNPSAGDIIVGTGGAKKTRYAIPGKGKSGGARIIYADITLKRIVYLLLCYGKNEQDDLTDSQKKQIEKLIKTIKGEI